MSFRGAGGENGHAFGDESVEL